MTIVNVSRPSMYGTEAVTVYAARLPFGSLFHLLSHVDAVHGAYYFLMHFVLLAGHGTFLLRLPSVLAMTAAAGLTARLARRLTGSDLAALFAGLTLVIAPLATEYGQAGRSYAIDTAMAVLTWSLFVTAIDSPADPRAAWRYYTLVVALTAYLHEMTLLVLAANLVTLVWMRSTRDVWMAWVRAVRWALVLSIPLLVTSVVQSRQVSWIKPATWNDLNSAYRDFLGPGTAAIALNVALIVMCCWVAARRDASLPGVTATRLCLPIFVVAPLLLIVESMIAMPLYGGIRYVVWVSPAMAVLIGAGLDHAVRLLVPSGARSFAAILGVGVLAASLASQWKLEERVHSSAGAPQDMLAAATYLHQHERPGDGVIFAPRSFYALRLGYRNDLQPLRDLVIGQSGRYGGRLYGTEMSAPAISDAVEDSTRIWLVGVSSPRGSTRPELAALSRNFHLVSQHHVTGMTLSLFQTSSLRPDVETEG